MFLWLDDVREPWKHGHIGAVWVKTADEAIEILKTGKVDAASLDHDLAEEHYPWNCAELPGPGEKTGYDVVLWLEQNPEFWPQRGVSVHSMNPAGGPRMRQVIDAHYGRGSF
jgi:hypothetical protein